MILIRFELQDSPILLNSERKIRRVERPILHYWPTWVGNHDDDDALINDSKWHSGIIGLRSFQIEPVLRPQNIQPLRSANTPTELAG
jgi:hypothetical protein